MKANKLRIGNFYHYVIYDELDERKKWMEVAIIDAQDLLYLSQGKDENYQPIPITEEWLLKFGFDHFSAKWYEKKFISIHIEHGVCLEKGDYYEDYFSLDIEIKYIHQLQNLYFALTGEELTIQNK